MQIDWTTFTLEIINFLALVWILKRFLYQPVLETVASRRAGIERTLASAKETEERASALKVQFEQRLAAWEREKAAARAQFDAAMGIERERQMQALTQTLAQERERSAARDVHRQDEMRHDMETRALAQARAFSTRLLTRLAGPQLEARFVDLFIEDLADLPEGQMAGVQAALKLQPARATVASAYPLAGAQQQRIAQAVAARLGLQIPVEFKDDASLLSGLRVSVGPWQLNLNVGDELASFVAAANHVD